MIRVEHLTKRFGCTRAVDDLSFHVNRGEIVGFLGPNGAGKTTTMRILAGFLYPTAGTVTIGGMDVVTESLDVRRQLGYLPENVPLYPDMRVTEYLHYRGRLKGLQGKVLKQCVLEVLESCGLYDEQRRIIGQLSKGYRQRVGLADALVHSPDLLLLDEPTIGLDPNQIRHIRKLIKSLAQRHTVLLSTHILSEVESICERVLIMHKGRIVASDTPRDLLATLKGTPRVFLDVRGPADRIPGELERIDGVRTAVLESHDGPWQRVVCECAGDSDPREALGRCVCAAGWGLRELTLDRPALEDVFVAMTTEEGELALAEPEAERSGI